MRSNNFLAYSFLTITFMLTLIEGSKADHPSKAAEQDFAQICQMSRDSIRLNQQRINQLQSIDDANTNYKSLIEQYNRDLARYTLFNGIRTIVNNYSRLAYDIRQATVDTGVIYMPAYVGITSYDPVTIFNVNGITDIVMIEQSISSILGSSINMQQLSQFSGPVCPEQILSSTDIITCPASTRKVSPLYLALRSQCTQTSNQSAPLCRTINLLNNPNNDVALEKTNELLESFRVNYQNAYLIESGQSARLNDPLNDLKKMRDALMALTSAEVYENGSVTYTMPEELSEQQVQRQQRLQESMPESDYVATGMQLLVNQAEDLSLRRDRSASIYEVYSTCITQLHAQSAADALCNGATIARCPHAQSFTPERIDWQRNQIDRCQRCYQEDARLCLNQEQIADLYPQGNIPPGGVKAVVEFEANQYLLQMRAAVDRSPLVRQMGTNGLLTRTAGVASVERATQLAMSRIGHNLTDLGNSDSILSQINSVAVEEQNDANIVLGYAERNGTASEIPVSELINGLYTGNNETSRRFRQDIQRDYQASLNEDILLTGIASGQSIDNLRGRLEASSQSSDGSTVFHQMLSEILRLKGSANGIPNLTCFDNDGPVINQEYLDQNRQNLEVIGNLMHKCVKEIGSYIGHFCEDQPNAVKQAECRHSQESHLALSNNVNAQERNLAALGTKLRQLENTPQFRELSSIQRQLFSLANQTCQGDQSTQIVMCQNRTSVPLESAHSPVSFLVTNTNEILGFVPDVAIQVRTPLQIISSLQRSCPRGERAATAGNMLPLCSYSAARATRIAEATPAPTGPLTEDIQTTRTAQFDDEATETEETEELSERRRPARPRTNLRPVPAPTNPNNYSAINNMASTFGAGLGSYYGQMSTPYGYNSGVFGLTSSYSFPSYPFGFSPYTGAFQSFSLSPNVFPSL